MVVPNWGTYVSGPMSGQIQQWPASVVNVSAGHLWDTLTAAVSQQLLSAVGFWPASRGRLEYMSLGCIYGTSSTALMQDASAGSRACFWRVVSSGWHL